MVTRPFKEERRVFSINSAGKTGYSRAMKLDLTSIPYKSTNYEWTKDLKLPKETIGLKLHDTEFGNDLLDMTPKAQETQQNR